MSAPWEGQPVSDVACEMVPTSATLEPESANLVIDGYESVEIRPLTVVFRLHGSLWSVKVWAASHKAAADVVGYIDSRLSGGVTIVGVYEWETRR